ncbi:hypothetical protein E4U41_007161 [Claviceps citrina]|nr:hypothetical protein E4U41_007161 [Claviceps citrina]
MDPAPDACQLRDEPVDTRLGTLGYHSFPRGLEQLQHVFDAEASALQFHSSSFSGVSSDGQSNLDPDSPNHQHLAAEAPQASILNPHLSTHHEPSSDTIRHASPPPIDPDDFYKNYRGRDASTAPDILPMAATSSSRPCLRSNGDGSTPRHPVVPAPHHLPRPNLRSVSSPLDGRPSAGSTTRIPTGKPSVKDLKKRFDQNAVVGVPTIPPPHARAIAGLKPTRLAIRSPVSSGSRPSSRRHKTLEDGFGRGGGGGGGGDVVDVGSPSQSPPPSKFVADAQLSGSTQSFASRVGKPRNSTYRASAPQRPITSTQIKSTNLPLPINSASRRPPSRGLLFGEISPDRHEHDAGSLGHGIGEIRPRRTSEPSVQIASSRQRNLYSPESETSHPQQPIESILHSFKLSVDFETISAERNTIQNKSRGQSGQDANANSQIRYVT